MKRLIFISAIPKVIALLRDYYLLLKFGLGVEVAIITSLQVSMQYIGNLLSPGIQSLATNNSGFINIKLINTLKKYFGLYLSIIYISVYMYYFKNGAIENHYLTILICIVISYLWVEINILSAYYMSNIYTENYDYIYFLDSLANIFVLAYLIFFEFNLNILLLLLMASNLILKIAYKNNINKLKNQDEKILSNIKKIISIIFFTFIISSTNIIDQILLSRTTDGDLALYNMVQKYTFVFASFVTLVLIRRLSSKIDTVDLAAPKILFIINKYKYKFTISVTFIIFSYVILYNEIEDKNYWNIISSFYASSMQIPFFILLTMIILKYGSKFTLIEKFLAASIAFILKYIYIFIFSISVTSIFISHLILNGIAALILISYIKKYLDE